MGGELIVDAHHHLWRYRAGTRPWLDARSELAGLRRDFLAPELAAHLQANGIDRTVIVQAADSLEDTAFMLEAARANPFIAGVVAWAPLAEPRAAAAQLDRYAGEPLVKGLRHLIIFDPDPDWCVRPGVIESLRLVAEHGLCWDSTATIPAHLEAVAILAERIPTLKQVIDHLGKPAASERRWEPWASLMARAAQSPNVYVKLSGLANVATLATASAAEFRPYVEHVLEHFGPRRVMIASNWPVSNLAADYGPTWQATLELIAGLPPGDRAEILGGTAERFYRL
jgi:L-fuconolactonase